METPFAPNGGVRGNKWHNWDLEDEDHLLYFLNLKFKYRKIRSQNKQGTRGKNKQIIDGGTAFYSDVDPGAQIFIGAPFQWDHVRAVDDFISSGASPIRGCESPDDDLPDGQHGVFWRSPHRVIGCGGCCQ